MEKQNLPKIEYRVHWVEDGEDYWVDVKDTRTGLILARRALNEGGNDVSLQLINVTAP